MKNGGSDDQYEQEEANQVKEQDFFSPNKETSEEIKPAFTDLKWRPPVEGHGILNKDPSNKESF